MFICTGITPSVAVDNVKKPSMPSDDGNILYVGGAGEGNYTKIQDAIDNASDGDTVFVFSGSYYEGIRIRNQINLIGEDKNTTIIEGEERHCAIILYDDYITISGFTINNTNDWANDCGIEIKNAWGTHTTHNTITGNIFMNHPTEAITVYESSYNTITDNLIVKSGGISTGSYSSYNIISNNTFVGSGISVWGAPKYSLIYNNHITNGGITVSRGSNNIVKDNVIENGSNIKITWDTTNNIVENNCLISSGTIILDESINTYVRFNTFKDSKGITISGSKLDHWNTHEIENNNINGNPIYSYKYRNNLIIPTDAAQVILADCQKIFMDYLNISNVVYGIQIINSTEVTVSSSNFIDNISNSIILLSSNDCNIYNNSIKNNFETGITILGISSNNVIENNDIINNKKGIVIEKSNTNNRIRNNILENNVLAIYVKGSMNSIKMNSIKNNGIGLYLYFSYYNIIYKNNFIGNGGKSVFFKVDYTRPRDNTWNRNYYGTSRFLPKIIWGRIKTKYHWTDPYTFKEVYHHRWGLNFDWFPASEPYNIEGVI